MDTISAGYHVNKSIVTDPSKSSVDLSENVDSYIVNARAVGFAFDQSSFYDVFGKEGSDGYKTARCRSMVNRNRTQRFRQNEKEGLDNYYNSLLECNQSFPCFYKASNGVDGDISFTLRKHSLTMDRIRVDGPNGIRFSAKKSRGCFTPDSSSLFGNSTSQASESIRISQSSINPNKAVFTIDAKTTEILIVNSNACLLLGYTSKELCEMKLLALLHNKNHNPASALAEGQFNSVDGSIVLLSGKVVEMIRKNGKTVPVSLWIRQLEQEGPCVAVAEPVQRRITQLTIDKTGCIKSADSESMLIFQCDSQDQLNGMDVRNIIPSIALPESDMPSLPHNVKKQKATGRTLDGFTFPLCLMLNVKENVVSIDNEIPHMQSELYSISVWVFSNLSGLVVISEDGIVESVNHHFTMLLFGLPQHKVIGQKITHIVPNFCEDFEYVQFDHSRNVTISSIGNSDTETDSIHISNKFGSFQKHSMLGDGDSIPIKSPKKSDNPNISNLSIEFTVPKSFCDQQLKSSGDFCVIEAKYQNEECHTDIIEDNSQSYTVGESVNDDIKQNSKELHFKDISCKKYVPTETESLHLELNGSKSIEEDLLTPVNNAITKITNDIENNLNISNTQLIQEQNNDSLMRNKSHFHMNLVSCEEDDELRTPINEGGISQVNIEDIHSNEPVELLKCNTSDNGSNDELNMHCENITPVFKRCKDLIEKRQHMSTSTPEVKGRVLPIIKTAFKEGRYKGLGLHADGNSLDIQYVVLRQNIPQNRDVFCVWVSFDPQDVLGQDNYTLTSSFNSTMEHSLGQAIKHTAQNISRPNSVSLISQCEEEQTKGEYNENYTTLRQIGKGAYGYVKMAYRNSDRLLVISKFIMKERVNDEFWVWDKEMGRNVPLEISLLSTLTHPNIVRVFDIFENEKFFQLIMEKHGSGMDLFEFIDRMPMLDELLISYIFRQIANAVYFLHSVQILHRDIKDENVIINHKFEVKLIDFGSATYFSKDSEFSTFYGTTEYCSPEVLAGNKYSGPELEMWSMGVTLFVLTFCVNPFEDIEETLSGRLTLPCKVSKGLEQLLSRMLCKDPIKRCTMEELMSSEWLFQPVDITQYEFSQVVSCDLHEVQPEQYYSADLYTCSSSGVATPEETEFLSENNTLPISGFSQTDFAKIDVDSKEYTDDNIDIINLKFESEGSNHSVKQLPEYHNDICEYDYGSWDEDSFS